MIKLLLASVIAIASAAAIATPANAGNVFLGGSYFSYGPFGDFYESYSGAPVYGPYWGGPYLNDAPGGHDDYDGGYVAPPSAVHARRHCRIETVRTRSADHRFMRQVRVCN